MPAVRAERIALPSARKNVTDVEEDNLTEFSTPHASNKHLTKPLPQRTKVHGDESDDDAAPEEILLSTAQAQSHVQRAQATGAALAQSLAHKRRRRRKDAMLKAQAASSGRKQKLSSTPDEDEENAIASPDNAALEEAPEAKDQISLDNLPAILPQSILLAADEAASAHDATTDALHKRSSRLNVRRRRAAIKNAAHTQIRVPTSKPPKDVRRGPVSVRVLETQSSFLPPKAVSATRSIRETWLKGRQNMIKAQAQTKKGRPSDNRGVNKMERRLFRVKGRARPFV